MTMHQIIGMRVINGLIKEITGKLVYTEYASAPSPDPTVKSLIGSNAINVAWGTGYSFSFSNPANDELK